ncbi:putative membrane protein YesL [Alkalihalobacillus xiaoxiensis]|uniref:Membrane protein YesL n=1 Tax=Shouchella xiaoxiensis TaxID=766895 RepID=A0ABS2SMV0_9BACI|nr:DUF624 domain-containing protein [Shouchella xiaoxiensis]MBM7836837.1 putative membrane protein YesL [Shouchella xiaoxiensis]
MRTGSLVEGLLKGCERFANLAYLNLLWCAFTLLGLGIFGVSPATIAVIRLLRKQKQEPMNEGAMLKEFARVYRDHFIQSNKLGLLLLVLCLSLVGSGIIMIETNAPLLIKSMLVFSLTGFAMIVLLTMPQYERQQTGPVGTMKIALWLGLSHLPQMFLLSMLFLLIACVFAAFPVVMFFFFASVPLALVVAFHDRFRKKYEEYVQAE